MMLWLFFKYHSNIHDFSLSYLFTAYTRGTGTSFLSTENVPDQQKGIYWH